MPLSSPLIWSTRSAAPDAIGAEPGSATNVVRLCHSLPYRGATDVVCRGPTCVAGAIPHPQIWNTFDRSDHMTAGCGARSFSSNITVNGRERRILEGLWQAGSPSCNTLTCSYRCRFTQLDFVNAVSTNRNCWLSAQAIY